MSRAASNRPLWVWRAIAGLLVGLALSACTTTPAPRIPLEAVPVEQRARAQGNLRVFNRVWSLVADWHFDPKTQGVDWRDAGLKYGAEAAAAADDKALYASLNAMTGLLKDSHTHPLSPAQARERGTRTRARTGFNMTRLEGKWFVSEVMAGSPAEAAGVRSGWIVVARNGAPFTSRTEARPTEGEVARWEFLDANDQPVTLDLVAKSLSTKPIQEMRPLSGGLVYLRFDEFDWTDTRWLSAQLKAHREAPGVVIDLRRNPGGTTISLGFIVGEFFDRSVDCGTFIWRGGHRSGKSSWQIGSARYRGRVAVLVDGSTGSAAEIFTAVLQEHGRATVIGRKTAGAVLSSLFHSLPDGGELQLSHWDYVTPKGRRLEGDGVEPDVKTARTVADLRAGRDPDLEAALRVLAGGEGSRPAP
ncbi:MAG: S41 family peptidase [Verrucomicrobia bacterium]|nr:S41 family peptidase [Verrucomicrobiota bacterium]